MKTPKTSWVVCYDYASGPYSEAQTDRKLANLRHLDYCPYDHQVVTSETRPTTEAELVTEAKERGYFPGMDSPLLRER